MIESVIEQRRKDLGGFEVGRLLPWVNHRSVGPFVFFDHMGPVDFTAGFPKNVDVRPHPHIGLATVTYLFEGELTHRDSVGSNLAITPGAVNWMTAGRGITHSERFERLRAEGGRMNALQAWVALPVDQENCDPAFAHYPAEAIPHFTDGMVKGRVLAGTAFGMTSPVKTLSPLFYVHLSLARGAVAALPTDYPERAAYVVAGRMSSAGQSFAAGTMVVYQANSPASIKADEDSVIMLLGGDSVGPRFLDWNFVASSKARLEEAKADWRAGRMKLPDGDNGEYIPLP